VDVEAAIAHGASESGIGGNEGDRAVGENFGERGEFGGDGSAEGGVDFFVESGDVRVASAKGESTDSHSGFVVGQVARFGVEDGDRWGERRLGIERDSGGDAEGGEGSSDFEGSGGVVGEGEGEGRHGVRIVGRRRYDFGMTKSKIAISLPQEQLARVRREVRAGRADSVSGYIARALVEEEKRESLRALVRDLIKQHGKPGAEDVKWAERALAPRKG